MITKFNKWVIKHPGLAYNLFTVIDLIALVVMVCALGWPIEVYVVAGLIILFVNKLMVASARAREINKAIKKLDSKCDPEPFYDITSFLVEYARSENELQMLLLNKSAALNAMGRYEESLEILNTLLIDKMLTMSPQNKMVYCLNKADTHINLENIEEAEIWLSKALEVYDAQSDSIKEKHRTSIDMNTAELCLRKGDYDRVGELINKIHMTDMRGDLEFRLLRAKYNIYRNNLDIAKSDLEYIISKGNKLYIVEKAKKLFEELAV